MAMANRYRRPLLFCVCEIVIICAFLLGFFRLKSPASGKSNVDQVKSEIKQFFEENDSCARRTVDVAFTPKVTRLVLIVIDALRADFVFSHHFMPWIRDMENSGLCAQLTAKVQTPTVTLPRIKAITGGFVPDFLDVVYNFMASSMSEDNILEQLKERNDRLLFFGDDTWLKLFPSILLDESEGTTSFDVTDFTEVDNNVTRHLDKTLSEPDKWDHLILHYLGLDHIGHSFGSRSHLVATKLLELDKIVKRIYLELEKQQSDFLIVVLGDHGMTDGGNHGGSTVSETVVPLLFLSPHIKPESSRVGQQFALPQVQQVDLVPTLSTLLGIPTPKQSIGVPINSILRRMTVNEPSVVIRNFEAGLAIGSELDNDVKYPSRQQLFNDAIATFCETGTSSHLHNVSETFNEYSHRYQQQIMTSKTSSYPVLTFVSTAASFLVILLLARTLYHGSEIPNEFGSIALQLHCILFLLHAVSFTSSSFVEEEQQFWYFALPTSLACVTYEAACSNLLSSNQTALRRLIGILAVLCLHRLCSDVNQTGIKWLHLKDLRFLLDSSLNVKFAFMALSFVVLFVEGASLASRRKIRWMFGTGLAASFVFRVLTHGYLQHLLLRDIASVAELRLPQLVYVMAVLLIASQSTYHGLMLICSCLISSSSAPILAGLVLMVKFWPHSSTKPFTNIMSVTILANCAYFYLGNSNSLSSLSVSAAYIGVNTYLPVANGMLMALHTYAGPLLVWLGFLHRQNALRRTVTLQRPETIYLLQALRFLPMSFCLLSIVIHQHHLFIWTVFAPKLIYECCHTLLCCVLICLL